MPLEHSDIPNETLAYLAGLFDGEGCVNFTQRGYYKSWVIRVMIRNADLGIVQYVQSVFGGRIETRHGYPGKPHWKSSYCWRIDGVKAVEFLTAIDPWIRIKKDQIMVAQAWDCVRNRTPGFRLDEEYRDMIMLLVEKLHWLNRKGKRVESDKEPIAECLLTLPVPIEQILNEVGICH